MVIRITLALWCIRKWPGLGVGLAKLTSRDREPEVLQSLVTLAMAERLGEIRAYIRSQFRLQRLCLVHKDRKIFVFTPVSTVKRGNWDCGRLLFWA